jgi:predicted house-cleaning NTP pyrophosphatase (Maf/HAM1 superfamily)
MAVTRIEGSWHNVVGLPVARLIDEMKKFITLAFPETDQKELK